MRQVTSFAATYTSTDDLADAAGYIARDSVHYAEIFNDDVLDAAEGLVSFRDLGMWCPSLIAGLP